MTTRKRIAGGEKGGKESLGLPRETNLQSQMQAMELMEIRTTVRAQDSTAP
jgi:hypothetical protein